jgi:hypothetical protein
LGILFLETKYGQPSADPESLGFIRSSGDNTAVRSGYHR